MRLLQKELFMYDDSFDKWDIQEINPGWVSQNGSWRDIIYSNNATTVFKGFAVVGDEGKIIMSADGINYNTPINPTKPNGQTITDKITAIATSDGETSSNLVYESIITSGTTDFIYGSKTTPAEYHYAFENIDYAFRDITWGYGYYVACDSNGYIFYASFRTNNNRMTWTQKNISSYNLSKVKYLKHPNIFVTLSNQYNNNYVYYCNPSSSLSDWSQITIGNDTRTNWKDITYIKDFNYYVIIGSDSGSLKISYASSNIFSWTTPKTIKTNFYANCAEFVNNRIIICGNDGKIITSPKIQTLQDLLNALDSPSLWREDVTYPAVNWTSIAIGFHKVYTPGYIYDVDDSVVIIGGSCIGYKEAKKIK